MRRGGHIAIGNPQRLKMLTILGQHNQIVRQGRRGDGDVGETRVATGREGLVGQSSRDPGDRRINRNYSITVEGQHAIKPRRKAGGPINPSGPTHLVDALLDFNDGDC